VWKKKIGNLTKEDIKKAEKEEEERRKNVDLWTQGRLEKRKAVYKIKEIYRKKLA
jgi:hypothetical protein